MFFHSSISSLDASLFPILITGTDSGFGQLASIQLAKQGYPVYAGCLTDGGIKALMDLALPTLRPVKMNVCKQEDVDRVFAKIKKEHGKLFCLVNNAGIVSSTFLELSDMKEWEATIQVNVIGAMRCAKGAIPLMRDFHAGTKRIGARIINISSASSFACAPSMSSYSASKAAIKNAGDCLRYELIPFNIHVTSVMPGFFKTNIVNETDDILPRSFRNSPKEIQDVYGEPFVQGMLDNIAARRTGMPDPSICVNEIVKCVLAIKPPTDKPVGYDSYILWYLLVFIPNSIRVFVFSIMMRFSSNKIAWVQQQGQRRLKQE
ncbi:Retinol dehydrogenase 5 [Kappamyces sp. JEL0680]|nr:Retinol dehydrogenase 5 [Kappamyces sp. JEL0680]